MARPTTGILTVNNTKRLNIKDLRRAGMLQRGQKIRAVVKWHRDAMEITADWTEAAPFLQLEYSASDGTEYKYAIRIEERSSNIGRGSVFYFRCPESGRRCRSLYMAYNYPRFKAREAYSIRIYYRSQLAGGRSRYNTRYFETEEQLEKLYEERQYLSYKGEPTRRALRQQMLEERLHKYDLQRWTLGLPPKLKGLIF